MQRADQAPITVTSVLNGAFMDMLAGEMPLVQPRVRRVLYWGDRHQELDLTTRDDVAAYTAAVALDPAPPRFLRVAGAVVSASDITDVMSEVTGRTYRPQRVGSLRSLDVLIRAARAVAPQEGEVFPAWQGMQYLRDQFAGLVQLTPLDHDRYPDVHRTPLRTVLAARFGSAPTARRDQRPRAPGPRAPSTTSAARAIRASSASTSTVSRVESTASTIGAPPGGRTTATSLRVP